MKKIIISNVRKIIETGENEDLHFHQFELIGGEEMDASDGYHTFAELYNHRFTLFISLCREINIPRVPPFYKRCWRSKLHSDGTKYKGWFILGINKEKGEQITYHLPYSKWSETNFAETLEKAPNFDGHTSNDVLERLKKL